MQHHEVLRYEDADRIFAEDGANAALLEAQDAGKLRYIGFTGHKDPRIHLHTLDVADECGVSLDSVQMPLNVLDAHFRSFERQVLPRLVRSGIGVIGMKSLANGILATTRVVTPIECLHYVLTLPASVIVTGIDSMRVLDQALAAVRTYDPLDEQDVRSILSRTADIARRGEYEPFKTTSIYDGTARNPEWLGEEPERAYRLGPDALGAMNKSTEWTPPSIAMNSRITSVMSSTNTRFRTAR